MLLDSQAEADRLEDLTRQYEMPTVAQLPPAQCRSFPMGTVTFRCVDWADRALHKIMRSPLSKVGVDNMGPFLRTFTVLPKGVFGFFDNARQRADAQESLGN